MERLCDVLVALSSAVSSVNARLACCHLIVNNTRRLLLKHQRHHHHTGRSLVIQVHLALIVQVDTGGFITCHAGGYR